MLNVMRDRRRLQIEVLEERTLLSLVVIEPPPPKTVINFDNLAPGTEIKSQYNAQGLDFTPLLVNSQRYYPIVTTVPAEQAMSGTRVAEVFGPGSGSGPPPEIAAPVIAGSFETYHKYVQVGVGEFGTYDDSKRHLDF